MLVEYDIVKKRKISEFALLVFLVSPILSFPLILFSIFYKERLGLFVLALFGGILSYSIVPSWELDLSRYYLIFQEISEGGFSAFVNVVKEQNDYVFFFIYYLFSFFGVNFQFTLFILSSFSFYASLVVFDQLIKQYNVSRQVYLMLIMAFVLSLPILAMLSVTRFSLGYTFFILFCYFRLINKTIWAYAFLFTACVTHFAYLVFIPALMFFSIFKNRRSINFMLIGLAIMSIAPGIWLMRVADVSFFPSFLVEKVVIYATSYEDTTLPLLSYSLLIPVVLAVGFYITYFKSLPIAVLRLFLATFLVVLAALPFNVIVYDRYIQVFKPIIVIAMMYALFNLYKSIYRKLILKLIILLLYAPFLLYYVYTFYAIYRNNLADFFSLEKLLLAFIFGSTYTQADFIN